MKIVTLMEDSKGTNECINEHGLSLYIETKNHKLLLDTGATDAFLQNANKLLVDLTKVDTVIISHGHYDHTGGLLAFLQKNPNVKVYMQKNATEGYYHVNQEMERYIGMDPKIANEKQIILLEEDTILDDELRIFSNVQGRKLWPKGNLELKHKTKAGFEQDSFLHEQYLVIQQEGKNYLLSGCAHNGILNILDAYKKRYQALPDVVISGFHMMQKSGYSEDDIAKIRETGEILKNCNTKFYTGHCTGQMPYQWLYEQMGEQIQAIHCGDIFSC